MNIEQTLRWLDKQQDEIRNWLLSCNLRDISDIELRYIVMRFQSLEELRLAIQFEETKDYDDDA